LTAAAPVLFEEVATRASKKIGIATLNRANQLNCLSLQMCRLLAGQLRRWELDDSIALVVLRGEGGKAFCAGGDLQSLYQSVLQNISGDPWDNAYAREFFAVEYRLDYQIHTYPKPLLCWGSGIVMGGGVGLMMGASHRIVTDTTRFAMPEIKIGFFPDVGGSWMLERLPAGLGMFLALTGTQLGAADCRYLGLADYYLPAQEWPALLGALENSSWSDVREENDVRLHQILRNGWRGEAPRAGPLQQHHGFLSELCDGPDFDAICAAIASWQEHSEPFLAKAASTFMAGSPGSARLAFTLQRAAKGLSLARVFQLEYTVALQCMGMGDFREGVRALIIDKDGKPSWQPHSIARASADWARNMCQPVWSDTDPHPLADL
jgi:enoyl-CoA hydratase/carnithine racemase